MVARLLMLWLGWESLQVVVLATTPFELVYIGPDPHMPTEPECIKLHLSYRTAEASTEKFPQIQVAYNPCGPPEADVEMSPIIPYNTWSIFRVRAQTEPTLLKSTLDSVTGERKVELLFDDGVINRPFVWICTSPATMRPNCSSFR